MNKTIADLESAVEALDKKFQDLLELLSQSGAPQPAAQDLTPQVEKIDSLTTSVDALIQTLTPLGNRS